MWYFYKLPQDNGINQFTNDFENAFESLFEGEEYGGSLKKNLSRCKILNNFFIDLKQQYFELPKGSRGIFRNAFRRNIDIENLCLSKDNPITYEQLEVLTNSHITKIVKKLDIYIYEGLKETASFKTNYCSAMKHYRDIRGNAHNICPFCGQEHFRSVEDDFREDFDHYFSKAKYPFISLHHLNLIPMCKKCNQDHKGEKNIKDKIPIFFPFTNSINTPFINIIEIISDIQKFSINGVNTYKIENWDRVFNIKKRSYLKLNSRYKHVLKDILRLKTRLSSPELTIENLIQQQIDDLSEDIFEDDGIFKIPILKYYLKNASTL